MSANTTAAELAMRADAALAAFVSNAPDYPSMADQLADLLAGLHVLARNGGIEWKSLVENSATRYKVARTAEKPAGKAPGKPASDLGGLWTLTATLPTGQAVSVQRSKPYGFAAAIQVAGAWAVYAWVSSKETATKRIGDARRGGMDIAGHVVLETTVAQLAEEPVEAEAEEPAEGELVTAPLPFDIEAEAKEDSTDAMDPLGGSPPHQMPRLRRARPR